MPGVDPTASGPAPRTGPPTVWALASQRSVVTRGLMFAVVVGSVLIAINHGDAIVGGQLTAASYLKMGLTVIVPYVVSVSSSVGATLEAERAKGLRGTADPDA